MAGKIQNADVKSEAELIGLGASKTELIHDEKIYVPSVDKTLAQAIADGDIGGGGGTALVDFYKTNSIGLGGNDGRTITASLESVPFDGTGTGWTPGINGSNFTDGNFYTVQYAGSELKIKGSVRIGANAAIAIQMYVDGALHKVIENATGGNTSRSTFSYISKLGEFTVGQKISFGMSVGGDLDNDDRYHYLNINETAPSSGTALPANTSNDDIVVECNGGTAGNVANAVPIAFTEIKDTHNAWNGTEFTAPEKGIYIFAGSLRTDPESYSAYFYVNGVLNVLIGSSDPSRGIMPIGGTLSLEAGDVVSIRHTFGPFVTIIGDGLNHYLTITKQGVNFDNVIVEGDVTNYVPLTKTASREMNSGSNVSAGVVTNFTVLLDKNLGQIFTETSGIYTAKIDTFVSASISGNIQSSDSRPAIVKNSTVMAEDTQNHGGGFSGSASANFFVPAGENFSFQTTGNGNVNSIRASFTALAYTNGTLIDIDIVDGIGKIEAFGSNTETPNGYLKCDGSIVSRTSYADLFNVIGENFGAGDGSTTFALPNLEGQFLRGDSSDASVDPDGPRSPGSTQGDELKSHTHSASNRSDVANAGAGRVTIGNGNVGGGDISLNSTGGDETRPTNVAVAFYIRYQAESKNIITEGDIKKIYPLQQSETVTYTGFVSKNASNYVLLSNELTNESNSIVGVTNTDHTRYTFKKDTNFSATASYANFADTAVSLILYNSSGSVKLRSYGESDNQGLVSTALSGKAEVGDYIVYFTVNNPSNDTNTFFSITTNALTEGTAYKSDLSGKNHSFSVYRNGGQIVSGAGNTVVYNTREFDESSAFNVSNGKFIVPANEGGKYKFNIGWEWNTPSGSNVGETVSFYVQVNGSDHKLISRWENTSTPGQGIQEGDGGSVLLDLQPFDEVTVACYETMSSQVTLTSGSTRNYFQGYKVQEVNFENLIIENPNGSFITQEKFLSADVTSVGTVSDLTIPLEIGEKYLLLSKFEFSASATSYTGVLRVNDGSQIIGEGAVRDNSSNAAIQPFTISKTFVATSSSLTVDLNTAANCGLRGNSSLKFTYVQVVKLPRELGIATGTFESIKTAIISPVSGTGNTQGATGNTSPVVMPLVTKSGDTDIVSINTSSDTFTLQPGKYQVTVPVGANGNTGWTGIDLYDVTNSVIKEKIINVAYSVTGNSVNFNDAKFLLNLTEATEFSVQLFSTSSSGFMYIARIEVQKTLAR